MSKLKLFSIYLVVNIFVLLIPVIISSIITKTNISVDSSYFIWYLLLIPLFVNIVTYIYVKKEKLSGIFMFLFLISTYFIVYCIYIFFMSEAFSNLQL